MPKQPALCMKRGCDLPRHPGRNLCSWHVLMAMPPDAQAKAATYRLERAQAKPGYEYRARVPSAQWPAGKRWCSGCQTFVVLFYTSGSRCKGCASAAKHEKHVQDTYGLAPGEYDALLALQGGRCAVCGRKPVGRRLAVDHDHKTGAPRGLLCGGDGHTCNREVVGTLEGATDGTRDGLLAAAQRLVEYFTTTPYERLQEQNR